MSFVNDGVRYQIIRDNHGQVHTFPATQRDVEKAVDKVSNVAENCEIKNTGSALCCVSAVSSGY